jgi:hypothetical protein
MPISAGFVRCNNKRPETEYEKTINDRFNRGFVKKIYKPNNSFFGLYARIASYGASIAAFTHARLSGKLSNKFCGFSLSLLSWSIAIAR